MHLSPLNLIPIHPSSSASPFSSCFLPWNCAQCLHDLWLMTKEGFPLPAQVRTTRLFPGHTPRFSEINVTPSRLLSLDKKGYGIWQTPPPTTFHKNTSFELAPLLPIMIMTITIFIYEPEHRNGWAWHGKAPPAKSGQAGNSRPCSASPTNGDRESWSTMMPMVMMMHVNIEIVPRTCSRCGGRVGGLSCRTSGLRKSGETFRFETESLLGKTIW